MNKSLKHKVLFFPLVALSRRSTYRSVCERTLNCQLYMDKSSVTSDREQGVSDDIKKLPLNSLTGIFFFIGAHSVLCIIPDFPSSETFDDSFSLSSYRVP